jgi:CheY-like chemotaxis protein
MAILIVEDTEELRTCVAQYLHMIGLEVVAAANAEDALAVIDSGTPIDLVFTDVQMPGAMNGVGLARWLATNRPSLPIVVTSGAVCPELEASAPSCRFVQKPYLFNALARDIRATVAQRPSWSSDA